jgi:hypothetical protein
MFCRSLFVLFLFVNVLSVLLRFNDSDYSIWYLQTLPTKVHILSVITYKVKINKQFNNVIYLHKKKNVGYKISTTVHNNESKFTNCRMKEWFHITGIKNTHVKYRFHHTNNGWMFLYISNRISSFSNFRYDRALLNSSNLKIN